MSTDRQPESLHISGVCDWTELVPDESPERDRLAENVAELREWLGGRRSMTNYIVGSLGGREGDSEIERRLIWEADNARIVALAALVNAGVAMRTPTVVTGGDQS